MFWSLTAIGDLFLVVVQGLREMVKASTETHGVPMTFVCVFVFVKNVNADFWVLIFRSGFFV